MPAPTISQMLRELSAVSADVADLLDAVARPPRALSWRAGTAVEEALALLVSLGERLAELGPEAAQVDVPCPSGRFRERPGP